MSRFRFLFATFAVVLSLLLAGAASAKTPPAEARKIEALIAAVESQPKAVFIRNGSEHTAAEAAGHLRLKWRNAGKRVATARDFIRFCATQSSLTGRRYRIRLADGSEMDSAEFFLRELRLIELRELKRMEIPVRQASPQSGDATHPA